jgi:hypothetical protein
MNVFEIPTGSQAAFNTKKGPIIGVVTDEKEFRPQINAYCRLVYPAYYVKEYKGDGSYTSDDIIGECFRYWATDMNANLKKDEEIREESVIPYE